MHFSTTIAALATLFISTAIAGRPPGRKQTYDGNAGFCLCTHTTTTTITTVTPSPKTIYNIITETTITDVPATSTSTSSYINTSTLRGPRCFPLSFPRRV